MAKTERLLDTHSKIFQAMVAIFVTAEAHANAAATLLRTIACHMGESSVGIRREALALLREAADDLELGLHYLESLEALARSGPLQEQGAEYQKGLAGDEVLRKKAEAFSSGHSPTDTSGGDG